MAIYLQCLDTMVADKNETRATVLSAAAAYIGRKHARAREMLRVWREAADAAAKNIEVLAGADREEARVLLAKVLAFDPSNTTRTTLQHHLARAGHPELLAAGGR